MTATSLAARKIKVSTEVWIACALLQREQPERADFAIAEIMERARKECIAGELRPGVYVHVVQHCVATRPPSPARYRMLTETQDGYRRLFCEPDIYHAGREGSKITPERDELPEKYRKLLDWYENEYKRKARREEVDDPILGLRRLGREIWEGVDPDAYVRELREGWE
jgi:hypothetical protein